MDDKWAFPVSPKPPGKPLAVAPKPLGQELLQCKNQISLPTRHPGPDVKTVSNIQSRHELPLTQHKGHSCVASVGTAQGYTEQA